MTVPEDPVPPVVQNVTAHNGFAYGVIGADIHVFGDRGEPVYLLVNWRPDPQADPAWLREVPSRMLNARFGVVPFTGRYTELEELRHWKEGPPLAVRWLHGPGGQGKTRLAAAFAAQAEAEGWKVVTAIYRPGAVVLPPGSQDLRLGDAPGVLLIVDYADRWPLSHLTWLLSNALLHQIGVRARVLLIARSLHGWPAVSASVANYQAGTSVQFLEPLPDEEERASMFTTARDSFADPYGIDPDRIPPPGPLDDPEMGLTLAVHMAALVAVDAQAHELRPPQGMAGLTIYLLNREHLHWDTLYGAGTHEADSRKRAYRTPPAVMNRVVFTAALTGPQTRPGGTAILNDLRLEPDPEQVLSDHAVCYPVAGPAGLTALEPLYPDRLAEDFLALTLSGHLTEYPAQSWAPGTITKLITGDDDDARVPHLARSLTFLATAAAPGRWRHVAAHLNTVLASAPALAIDAGSAALTALAQAVDISVLEAIETHLPAGRHVDLDVGAAAVSTALTSYRLAHTIEPSHRAELLHTHAWRLANAGIVPQALAADQEAADLYRRLADANPTYLPGLATSLNNLGVFLSKLGRRDQAVATLEEAVSIRQRLADANPAAHLPDLAISVSNLSRPLSELGRPQEAFAAEEKAVSIRRRLVHTDSAAHLPGLAMSLNNLGILLSDLGRREEALTPAREAADLYRPLAEASPAAYLPDFAMSLNNLGNLLSKLGRHDQALTTAEEAVRIRQRLADANSAAYLPDLATSLNNLANRLFAAGRPEEALAHTEEAVRIRRRLAETNPAAHLPALATGLTNLGAFLSGAGRSYEALTPAQEAVIFYRRLADANPAAYLPGLAMSLNNVGNRLSGLGRHEEALTPASEAADLYRQLTETNPAHLRDLTTSLNNLANLLTKLDPQEEALATLKKALATAQKTADLYRA